ncbi:EF-hand domain-containing protein [Luteimonas sp. e5]
MKQRKTLAPLLIASAFALAAAPLAFAQDAQEKQQEEQTQQQEPPAAEAAPQQAQGASTSWNDLDVDGNGSLSKEEASKVPSLAEIFDQADADKDGQLTADEYKAFVAENYPQQQPTSEQGGQ